MKVTLLCNIVLLLLFMGGTSVGLSELKRSRPVLSQEQSATQEVLYLPSGRALEFISFGYRNLLSDILWFNTINYFGKHYASDRNYQWLKHMCGLVTRLDPRKRHVYEFCSTMLAWEAADPQGSIAMLTSAIKQFPDQWRLYFQRGFAYMFFLKNSDLARDDFITASKLPDAQPIAARLAAKKLLTSDDPAEAVEFLIETIKSARDPTQIKALEKRLRQARYELDLRALEKGVEIFKSKNGTAPLDLSALVASGIITALPVDPYGGKYYLDKNTGEVRSSSNKKRLTLDTTSPHADHKGGGVTR